MRTLVDRLLQITVVTGGILLALSGVLLNSEGEQNVTPATEQENAERNERSTPRSFILPATPGVAFEQERQRSDRERLAQVAKCLAMLRNLGFRIDDVGTLLNAKLVEAIYTFQSGNDLPASGQLDEATMRKLGCL